MKVVSVRKIPLSKPIITGDMVEAMVQALQNEKLVMGESVYKFEEEFARFVGVKYAVSVNSGTSALLLCYHALGVKVEDEVLAPSATFISTTNGAVILGARPVFAEINPETYTLDTRNIEVRVSVKCKVVVPVHLYGYPANMDPIIALSEERGVFVLEDAAQAHGAKYKDRRVGSIGGAAVFSFYSIKNMTVGGDGGMVTTNDPEIAHMVSKLRDVGRRSRYLHDLVGYTMRLNTVNAAIGRVQLRHLDEWNRRRRQIAKLYDEILSGVEEIKTPPPPDSIHEPVYHLYVIRVRKEHRNALGAWLTKYGVQAAVHYPVPVHLQPAYDGFEYKVGDLPLTEKWSETVLSIPLYVEMSDDDVKYVAEAVQGFYEKRVYTDKDFLKVGKDWIKRLT